MRLGRRVVTVEVGFCSALGGAFNLLGRKGVFDKFRVTVSTIRKKWFRFCEPR
jgi:hypothetical protein